MPYLGKDFAERLHHKVALPHKRMGYLEVRVVHPAVIIEQDVDIDDTVMIDPSDRLLLPPHFALNALGGGKQIMRTEWREAQHGGIGEEMLRCKTPWLSDIKS